MAEGQRPAADAGPCPIPLERRLAAALDAGFAGIGLNRADYEALVAQHGAAGLAQLLKDSGASLIELETLTGWWLDDPNGTIWRRTLDCMLELCASFPVHQIKVNGDFTDNPPPVGLMQEGFARLVERVRGSGTVIGVEPVAFSNIRDAATARNIVSGKAGYGGGVTLDNWHFARTGQCPQDLGGLAGTEISGVEISNVAQDIAGSLFEDTLDHRRLPNDGVYDVPAFIRAIAATGYCGPVGCEVLSIDLRAIPLEMALAKAASSARAVLAAAAAP
jgi:sugar phosphate isomerase/epimerase